jgi:RHS repeat-associated protein
MDAGLVAVVRSQALVVDTDGDTIADSSDNCPTIANKNQANRNGVGPGDACELSLSWSCGTLTDYARFGSFKELITRTAPLTLSGSPDLMRVAASAPSGATAYLSSQSERVGVKTSGESSSYYDAISGSEVLRFNIGTDGVLGGAKASDVWLHIEGSATVSATFYSGSTSLGTKTASNSGTTWKRLLPDAGALFDRVEIRATSGRFSLKGAGDGVLFTLSQVQVSCPSGYQRVGSNCVDIDECAGLTRVCDALTTCSNTPGSFTCGACPSGYRGTGATSCIDINECSENPASCSSLVACSNTPGSFSCGACPSGYRGDGRICADINECAENLDTCDALVSCSNTPGSYTCGACPAGYSGGGQTGCVDVNECVGPNAACDPLTTCTNQPGSYACSPCPSGYRGAGNTSCVDVDECAEGTAQCSPLATCANTAGAYQCGDCPNGYRGDGFSCVDVDECAEDTAQCSTLVSCQNRDGGYTCGACPSGYSGDGITCTDIDECVSAPCDPRTTCENRPGSYLCGACPGGFTGNGHAGCVDIDECAEGRDTCSPLVSCANFTGGYSCSACPDGYSGDGHTCMDIDECVSTPGACAAQVSCTNNPGSFTCGTCPPGYAGDGHTCTDVDECVDHPCHALTSCSNTLGSYTCGACPPGYTGDGYAGCLDIDECAVDNGGCANTHRCRNTPGARECITCAPSAIGVGTHCGTGACAATGVTTCVLGLVVDSCSPGTPSASDATCNAVDDDCDGQIDEQFPIESTSCGIGACASTGARSCQSGQVVDSCVVAPGNSDSDCDGADDDCDGIADDDFVVATVRCGVGACAASAKQSCVAGQIQGGCQPGLPAPSDVSCDGRDDDCDGTADEDAQVVHIQCGVGACVAQAARSCGAGQWTGACVPLQPISTTDTTCNGIDDDCDGAIDEDFAGTSVGCGLGACTNVGATLCVSGAIVSSCAPLPALAVSDNQCDGIDADCDGSVDEDVPSQPTSCGKGVCARTGTLRCISGQLTDSCTAGTTGITQDTSCDNVDNDCDGKVDEDFSGACNGTTAQVCLNGALVNQTNCSDGLVCNGLESCSAGKCVHPAFTVDDNNPCTVDSCSEPAGVVHVDLPFGTSCTDGDACNGVELCIPCLESENLLVNSSFETFPQPNIHDQGFLPSDWWSTNYTPDTYSSDGSWGLRFSDFGNFTNVTTVPDGLRFIAGGSPVSESFAQELKAPLVTGQRYRVSAKMHQSSRSDIKYPGGYDVYLSSEYIVTNVADLNVKVATYRPTDIFLGKIGTTVDSPDWVDVSLEFVAPANIKDKLLINFIPYAAALNTGSYPGIDLLRLTRACSKSGALSCQRQEAPVVDDEQPCTQDSCTPSLGVLHTQLASGAACNGTGTCTAVGACTNRPPVFLNTPSPYHIQGSPNYFLQMQATDPDGDPVTFARGSGSTGSSWGISSSGLLNFFPSGYGIFVMSLEARDSRGGVTVQRKLVQVLRGEIATPFVPDPPKQHAVRLGETFSYQLGIWLPNPNLVPSFSFLVPPPEGMTITPSGLVTWTPNAQQLGTQEVAILVNVAGANSTHRFALSVLDLPLAPHFSSTPATRVAAGQGYYYLPTAVAGEQPLTVKLALGPSGMTQDAAGALIWPTSQLDIGEHSVVVVAAQGNTTIRQEFRVAVVGATGNRPPVIAPVSVPAAIVGQPYTLDLDGFDPEGAAITFFALGLPTGASMNATTGLLTWTPAASLANQTVTVRIGARDPSGLQVSADIQVRVLAMVTSGTNHPPEITSRASSNPTVGVPFTYQLTARDSDFDPLRFGAPLLPGGATFNIATGQLSWTPSAPGPHDFIFSVSDPYGYVVTQALTLVVQLPVVNLPPQITSAPPAQGFAYRPFSYDVDAFEPESEPVQFSLVSGPQGMSIDASTGLISWLPTRGGVYSAQVSVRDPDGATATQSFDIEVWADDEAPLLVINASPRYPKLNQPVRITVDAQDTGPVPVIEVLLDGVPVTLDASSGFSTSFTQLGRHELLVNASDAAGNLVSETFVIGVSTDGTPNLPPTVAITGVVDDEVITLQKTVSVTVSDDDLLTYRLTLVDAGTGRELRTLRVGSAPVQGATGLIDATMLVNGYHLLRLTATDAAGHTSTTDVPVKIDGGAKVGLVQLSLVDVTLPAPGFDLQIVRSYDSRRADQSGDFGFGWQLDMSGPTIRHNRPVGNHFALWTDGHPFALPCREQGHVRSHFTEVRISDTEFYVFSPVIYNADPISGTCVGQVFWEQVDGSAIGAELTLLDNAMVYPTRQLDVVASTPPEMDLLDVFTSELFNPEHFQLHTPDGRVLDLTTTGGLNWVKDANDNGIVITANSLSHSSGKVLGLIRDTKNRITSVRTQAGDAVSYAYDGAGNLRTTTSAEGYRTHYEYAASPAHHMSKLIDPEGVEQALFSYDPDGRLRQSCGAENHCVELQHDLANRTEWFIDGEEELRHTYDARGNVLTETNALNETSTYTYDARDRLLTSQSPLGELTTNSYDRNGNLLSTVAPHEANELAQDFTTTHTYGALERRTSTTLASGAVLRWEYDAHGNELFARDGSNNVIRARTYGSGGRVLTETNRFGTWTHNYQFGSETWNLPFQSTDPLGRVTTYYRDDKHMSQQTEGGIKLGFSYDKDGRPTLIDYGSGLSVRYEYTGSSKEWSAIEGPTIGRVERRFWADGKLSRITEPNGDVREFYYDANRRLRREIDALNNATDYVRDRAGRVTEIQEAVTGGTTKFTHDSAGRVLTRKDAYDHTTTMSYRAGGRLATLTDARSHTRSFSETPTTRTVVDALSRSTVRQLSGYGLTTGTSLPGGTSTALTYLGQTRDDESQRFPLSVRDEGNRNRSYGYDTHGGMTSATDLGGANGWQYTYALTKGAQITWDAESGSVSLVPVDARASAYEFSPQDNREATTASGATSDSHFTSELRTVRTPLGDVTTFDRDSAGRPSATTLPWGAQKTYAYADNDANPETVTLPQGTSLSFQYDAAKRETRRTSSAGESRSFTYGKQDRLQTMTDATGTTTYEYDAAGRFSGIVYPHGGSVRYVRDALGRTVEQAVRATAAATPLVTRYAYDAVGNLSEVTDPRGGKTTFVHDVENRLTSRSLPNNVVTTYTYDGRDRPLSVVHRNAANLVLASRTYVRAPGGEPTRITKEDGSYVEVGYDAALRITSERYFTSAGELDDELAYTYDADGNRLTKTVNGVASTYAYASGARLTGITTAGVTEGCTTDSGGRETALALMSHQLALTYDSDDHVTRVVDGASTTDFAFDAAGRRVGVTSGGSSKRFLTAPNAGDGYESPQAVTDASGALIASYVFAGETPIAKSTSAGTQYYLTDALGSVIATSGETGTLVSTLDYDAFGNERTSAALAGDTHGDFRLHGMWKDPSGLYYVRARVYDAETGRFTSRDTASGDVEVAETLSPYAFANANPRSFIDPSGLFTSAAETGVALGGQLALATVAISTSNFLQRNSSSNRPGQEFRVSIQAQGAVFGGPIKKRTRSVSFTQYTPVTVAQGLEALERVRAQLTRGQVSEFDDAEAFEDAARWIRGRPPVGAGPPGRNRFGERSGVDPSYLRVDVAIYAGVNFVR